MWILKSKWIEMQRRIQKLEIESTEREDRTRKIKDMRSDWIFKR